MIKIFDKIFLFNTRKNQILEKPKKYDVYWTISPNNSLWLCQWFNRHKDRVRLKKNLVFNSEIKAIQAIEERKKLELDKEKNEQGSI